MLWKAVSRVPDGIIATGWKSAIDQPLSEPATQTVPPRRTRRSESTAVRAPTRSSTWSGSQGSSSGPSSITTWETPAAVSTPAFSGCRVVEAISTPWPAAIDAAARPTEDVPPRISSRVPRSMPSASSAPWAVRYVSGSAARTSHGNVVVIGISSAFGNSA